MNGVWGSFNQLHTTQGKGIFSQWRVLWYEGEAEPHAEETQMESESYNGADGRSLFNYNYCISPSVPLRFTPNRFHGDAQKTR